jgi:hypothetical protein
MKDTKDPNALSLGLHLRTLAARLEAKDAANAATTLLQAMKETKNPFALRSLAEGLSAVATRMEAKDAATVTAQAATTFFQAMKDTKDTHSVCALAQGLSALGAPLEAEDAARAATTLVQAIKETNNGLDLGLLALHLQDLSASAAHMEPKDAAQAFTTLVQVMKDTKEPNALCELASGLSVLAARMEPKAAATVTAQAANTLVKVMNDTKDPDRYALPALAQVLSALAARMEAKAAATVRAQAATTLLQVMMKDTKYLFGLAQALAALGARLEAKDAARAATTFLQVMKNTEDIKNASALTGTLSALTARMEAKAAATVTRQAATILHLDPDSYLLMWNLSALLSDVAPAEIRPAAAGSAVALAAGTVHPLTALVLLIAPAEPPPCRLSTQRLVDLLKLPTCFGARRVILDHLGNRYHRTFKDQWEFVRFAREQNLDLDFTTPPHRPEAAATAATKP